MKDLTQYLKESLEVETMSAKAASWLSSRPDEAEPWNNAVSAFQSTHQHDDASIQQFIEKTDIKGFMQFLQDDINADVSGLDPAQTIKQIISNLK